MICIQKQRKDKHDDGAAGVYSDENAAELQYILYKSLVDAYPFNDVIGKIKYLKRVYCIHNDVHIPISII